MSTISQTVLTQYPTGWWPTTDGQTDRQTPYDSKQRACA